MNTIRRFLLLGCLAVGATLALPACQSDHPTEPTHATTTIPGDSAPASKPPQEGRTHDRPHHGVHPGHRRHREHQHGDHGDGQGAGHGKADGHDGNNGHDHHDADRPKGHKGHKKPEGYHERTGDDRLRAAPPSDRRVSGSAALRHRTTRRAA